MKSSVMGKKMKITCVGGGTIGSSWALIFALKGHEVTIYDVSDDVLINSNDRIRTWLKLLLKKGFIERKQIDQTIGKINSTLSLNDAVMDADHIQESVFENLNLKKKIFDEVSLLVKPSAILASSSSGLSITEIQKVAKRPERCIIIHPINPPHLIPLVEIVPGKKTSPEVVNSVYDFMLRLGKIPIIVRKQVPGFVFNRLAAALWREALNILDEGVATVDDIDKVVYAGMGLRWAIMGPFLTYHLGGGEKGLEYFIHHIHPTFSKCWKSMRTWTVAPRAIAEKAVEGVKQMNLVKEKSYKELVEWRDDKLIELVKLLFDQRVSEDKTS